MVSMRAQLLAPRTGWYRTPLARYRHALKRFPFSTKCLTCALGMALGDVIAQLLSSKRRVKKKTWLRLDLARTARAAAFGGLVSGPLAHVWYNALDNSVLPSTPTHPVAVLSKCVLDQTLMAPLCTILFFSSMKLMERRPTECISEVRNKFFPSLMASYRLWPAAHLINFAFVPSGFRILYINMITVAWSVALSSLNENTASAEVTDAKLV
eukprot:g9056.t1